jgi:hypothetical protein
MIKKDFTLGMRIVSITLIFMKQNSLDIADCHEDDAQKRKVQSEYRTQERFLELFGEYLA